VRENKNLLGDEDHNNVDLRKNVLRFYTDMIEERKKMEIEFLIV